MDMYYKEHKWCVADFETTTEEFYEKQGFTKVWLWSICDSDGMILSDGETIDTFMKYVKNNLRGYTIYFHNLKFDSAFILSWLLEHEYPQEIIDKTGEHACFNTLISDMGAFYQIEVCFKKGIVVRFQDSLKVLPFTVKKIAQDFGFEIQKGIIDYNDYTINDETLSYIHRDVQIVAYALKELKQNGMNKMTTASCAYNSFMEINSFAKSFLPELEEDFLIEWRKAYRGGRSQVNPKYASQLLYGVKRYDINSMYPHIMHNAMLPYGKPIPIHETQRGTYNFELYKVNISFRLKEGHLPVLLNKFTSINESSYYTETNGIEVLHISNIDYELLERHYDIYFLEFVELYGFSTTDKLFKSYIDYWYPIKNREKGAKRLVAKMMLNSLYGKFGSNCKGRSKIPTLNENGILKFEYTEEQNMKKYYLPIAIAITSYAHKMIDDAIMISGLDKFVYCDTDSIHTLGELPEFMVHQSDLGKFKLEGIESKSKYVRQKTYIYTEEENGETYYTITCCGMDDRSKQYCLETYREKIFDVFEKGFEVVGYKLMPQYVKGGIILKQSSFKIRR